MRQIVLDTETTGLETSQGHRVIEIGGVELVGRRMTGNNFHHYLDPERDIDEAASEVHGITLEDLAGKPLFDDIAADLLGYLRDAELIIHNAPFDVGFLNHEFARAGYGEGVIEANCSVLDTLVMARNKHPGQKNSLDALCRRYEVDNTQRTLHGALLDAEILADVYLQMTGGQTTLLGESEDLVQDGSAVTEIEIDREAAARLPVIRPSEEEQAQHERWLALLREKSGEAVFDR